MRHRLLFEKLPPSVNDRYGVFRGRMILRESYRQWLKAASQDIQFYCAQNKLEPITEYTVVELYWTLPSRRADHHNFEKPLFDALQRGGAFKNDRLILNRTMQLSHIKGKEGVMVEFDARYRTEGE